MASDNNVENAFALARKLGIIRPGVTLTYTEMVRDLQDAENAYYEQQMEADMERRMEQYYESGGPGGERYAWEAQEDERRAWR